MATERQVARHGPFADFIANGVKVGNMIYLSGQVSVDDQGQVVAPGDLVAQSRQAYAHIRSTLEELGATMADIVDETVFVTDIKGVTHRFQDILQLRGGASSESLQLLITYANDRLKMKGEKHEKLTIICRNNNCHFCGYGHRGTTSASTTTRSDFGVRFRNVVCRS